jgi:drug/metabolite transporter (DMT)-like permease
MPTILVALGYTSIRAQLYTVPVYAVATFVSIFMSWLSDKLRRRGLFISAGALIALTGYAMLANLDHQRHPQTKYAAVYIAAIGIFFIGTTVLAWCLNNVANSGRRAVSSAFVVAMGNFGSVIATWAYLPTDAPRYKTGHYINLGAEALVCILGLTGIIYIRWENRVRDKGGRNERLVGLTEDEVQVLGFRHPEFRYVE